METNISQLSAAPTRHHYRIGFFWPVVLIGLGVILLLNNMNVLPGNAWDWALRLWPVILVAWGLDELLRGEFIGAALLVGLGGLFLAINFGGLTLDAWDVILRLWPLFLIAAGLGIIFNRRWFGTVGALVGALVILAILAGAVWLVGGRVAGFAPVPGQRVVQAMSGATKATVEIEPAAGSIYIKALPEATSLVEGTINLQRNESLYRNYSVDNGTATLKLRSPDVAVGFNPAGSTSRHWDLGLNPDVPIALKVNMGVGSANLDLSDLTLSSLDVNMAVGSASLTLPRAGHLSADINGAIGSTTIIVPPGLGVRVRLSGLTVANVLPGFEHNGNTYTSPNYATAAAKVDLSVNQAMGAFSIHEQTGR